MMKQKNQLPSLITLLEDESIRTPVMRELAAFGPSLEDELERAKIPLDAERALLVRSLLSQRYREWLIGEWPGWVNGRSDKQRLEAALALLGQFQLGRLYPAKLPGLLDALADEYDARYTNRDALTLAEFLFQGYGLRGAGQEDYYNPLNSNLVRVIERRQGIPISLATIYILTGSRLGLKIEGCNFPGHFLAIAGTGRTKVVVDCFNGGAVIDEASLASVRARVTYADVLRMRCNAPVIIARVLRNLTNAYRHANDEADAITMETVLAAVENLLTEQFPT